MGISCKFYIIQDDVKLYPEEGHCVYIECWLNGHFWHETTFDAELESAILYSEHYAQARGWFRHRWDIKDTRVENGNGLFN